MHTRALFGFLSSSGPKYTTPLLRLNNVQSFADSSQLTFATFTRPCKMAASFFLKSVLNIHEIYKTILNRHLDCLKHIANKRDGGCT